MKNKKLIIPIIISVLIFTLTGCGSSNSEFIYDSSSTSIDSIDNSSIFYENGSSVELNTNSELNTNREESINSESLYESRKLIKTVEMDIETENFEDTIKLIEVQINELGGYIEDMRVYNGSNYSDYNSSKSSNITVRIPKEKLPHFLKAVEGVSNVTNKQESTEDVTLMYVDLESHKKVLLEEQEVLLKLMGQAEEISEIIDIENRLTEVRYQIESMESKLRIFDNKINYSTVYLNIEEVEVFTPIAKQPAIKRIIDGFVTNTKAVYEGIIEFIIWFIANIPYFIIWIIVIFFVHKITLWFKKRKKNKQNIIAANKQTVQQIKK